MQDVAWITDAPAFAALADRWDELAERERLPFMRHAWLAAWWRAFGGGRSLAVCVVHTGARLDAGIPMVRGGGRLEALAHPHHSPVFRPLARDPGALTTLVAAVARADGSELVVHALADNDPAIALLTQTADGAVLVEPQHVSPLVDTRGDFVAYRGALDRSKRKEIERRRRRFSEEHHARVEIVRPDDLGADLAAAYAVEERGWKGARGTAIAQDEAARVFYDAVAHAFHAHGRLRIARILAGDRLVAFDLCLLDFDRLWVLKGSYDEEFARFAPGLSLAYAEVEWCFEHGLEGLELLGDDEPWKRVFATDDRRHVGVRVYRRRPVPLARYAWRGTMRPALRHVYRRIRPFKRGRT